KRGKKETFFHIKRNRCDNCGKTKLPIFLLMKYKNAKLPKEELQDWNNLYVSCLDCQDKPYSPGKKKTRNQKSKVKRTRWEYKAVGIRCRLELEQIKEDKPLRSEIYEQNVSPENLKTLSEYGIYPEDNYVPIYEFFDAEDLNWVYLVDDDDKIDSYNLDDILNYFGNEGWELVSIETRSSEDKLPDEEAERYDCVFKRRVIE
ncbi:MAG: DUF4177 domain-containing protein, partial [Candidatus Hodarchaeota archaeon]